MQFLASGIKIKFEDINRLKHDSRPISEVRVGRAVCARLKLSMKEFRVLNPWS
jgi:hypothetical protein